MNDSVAIILALIGIVGTFATLTGIVIKALFSLLNANTKALEELAVTTSKGTKELGEQNIQIAGLVAAQGVDLSAIRETNEANAETNARVEKILIQSVDTLANNEEKKTKATRSVRTRLAATN